MLLARYSLKGGDNAKEVVKRLGGWGLKVIYSNRKRLPTDEEERLGGVRYVSIAELLSGSDIISLHCPLTLIPDISSIEIRCRSATREYS